MKTSLNQGLKKKNSSKSLGLLENRDVKVVCHLNFSIINFKGDGGKTMIVDWGR